MKLVVTTNDDKSAEVIVPRRLQTSREGLNFTEKSGIITDYWTDNRLNLILRKDNLNKAYKRVKSNKGAGGTDGMQVDELLH